MQAVILVGGEGTRLRPLTSTVPKPAVTLVDRPFMAYMLEWLRSHGVDHAVMSLGFLADGVRNVLGDGTDHGVKLEYVEEPRPLGTAGALKYAEDLLEDRFFMLNGDVLTDIDLTEQLAQHERTGARGTLALIGVDDPSNYGLVRRDEDGSVKEFLEKPSADQIDTNLVSAGAYLLERDVLDLIPAEANVSIEREVFPLLVGKGLYGYEGSGYWLDIGTPDRYLQGTFDILERNVKTQAGDRLDESFLAVPEGADSEGRVIPPALVNDGAKIGAGARIGTLAVLGRDVSVGAGSSVEQAVVLDGSKIGENCHLRYCIVGDGVTIGDNTTIDGGAVLGQGVTIGAHNVISRGARIFPGVTIPDAAIKF